MKKLYSLIKACMSNDMSLFKIKTNKNNKRSKFFPIFIALFLMFMIWGSANTMFEKLYPMHLSHILLSLFVFSICIMTFFEGIYKSGPLIFNCKDDQLLLSLPIKRSTVFFVRVFKFYLFELLFNSLFLLPIMISYIRWADSITWTYYLTSIIMLLLLPIIPIVLSCIIGVITSSISSKFKFKNLAQIVLSMIFLIGIMLASYNMDSIFNYIVKHSTSINDLIIKIYYPAGIYTKLVVDFNILDLLIFILVNIVIFVLSIIILGKFYFKINSRLKNISTSKKKIKVDNLTIKSKSQLRSLISKEINTFINTPVLIINAGFALVIYILISIVIAIKFNSFIPILTNEFGLDKNIIMNNLSIVIFILISLTAFMTSITNSLISLEGRNIRILKSLPIKTKTILLGKVLAPLLITTPIFLIGDIILFITTKISILEIILLILLSILIPLVSHFIGIIINLKYPKLDWESTTEVVKQSTSSFISVLIGMILFALSVYIIIKLIGNISSIIILLSATIIFIIIDIILYIYLINRGVKDFNNLNV